MGLIDTHPGTYLPRVDGSFRVIDHSHAEIHNGVHYTFSQTQATTTTAVSVLITTPAASEFHTVFSIGAGAAASWTFSEAPNATVTGATAMVAYNNNRQSTTTSGAVVVSKPTFTSTGTVLQKGYIGAYTNPAKGNGDVGEIRNEWILKASTKYLIQATPVATGTIEISGAFYAE